MDKQKDPGARPGVDRDRKHDVDNTSRDKADDPQRASPRGKTGEESPPGGHGPTTPGTKSDPDSPD